MGSEADVIAASSAPITVSSLVADLAGLGLARGDVVIVHSSVSALGWIAGGPQAVVEALLTAVGPEGTIVMPSQSGQLSDPALWSNPPVPEAWVPILRAETPAYDPHLTPTRGMGSVVECFRAHPEACRSAHPTLSFVARGPQAAHVVASHTLAAGLGDDSPLGRLEELDAQIALLGVGHANNTALHLAEHRASWPGKASVAEGCAMSVEGERRWVVYDDLDRDEADFEAIGAAVAASGAEHSAPVGHGVGRLLRLRPLVAFAVDWMETHRGR